MKNLVLAFVALAIALPTFAQKKFEGTITFGLEYQDLPAEMAAMSAMLPDEMITQIKGDKTRLEQSLGMGMSQVTITDLKKGSGTLLMNMMGKNMAVEMSWVIPLFNDAASLDWIVSRSLEFLNSLGVSFEIILGS